MSQQLANPSNNLRAVINSDAMKRQFAAALPRHLTPERFCRIAITALTRTPKLADCTQESLMKCLLDLSALGLEPDGRRAHLIPYKDQCTLIIDWKGLAELALRSGMIARLHADLICENDVFDYNLGEILTHRINFKEPRGEPYAAYAMAETKDGAKFVQVMTREQIESIRDSSQGYRAAKQYGKDSPWTTSPGEMWKKTAFRRLAKWLPLSAEFRDALDKDDEDPPLPRDVTPSATESKLFADVNRLEAPANNGKHEEKPADKLKAKGKAEEQPAPVDAELLSTPSIPLPQQIRDLLKRDGVVWSEVIRKLVKQGFTTEEYASVEDAPDELLKEALSVWAQVVEMIKGKGAAA